MKHCQSSPSRHLSLTYLWTNILKFNSTPYLVLYVYLYVSVWGYLHVCASARGIQTLQFLWSWSLRWLWITWCGCWWHNSSPLQGFIFPAPSWKFNGLSNVMFVKVIYQLYDLFQSSSFGILNLWMCHELPCGYVCISLIYVFHLEYIRSIA